MASRCAVLPRSIWQTRAALCRSVRVHRAVRQLATSAPRLDQTANAPSANDPITRIVDEISKLTLLQAADLVSQLKTRLNIQEIALPSAAPAAAAAAAPTEEVEVEKPKEKTIFTVHLQSFEDGAKAKVIREVKAIVPGLNLMDAKKFVESLPKVLKENQSKEDAEKLQKAFAALGAVVKLD